MKLGLERQKTIGGYILLTALIIASFAAIGSWSFRPRQVPKNYTVTLPLESWQRIINHLDSTNKLITESDIPARKAVWANGGLSNIMQTIQFQVSKEMQEEQKKDSTKPKNK